MMIYAQYIHVSAPSCSKDFILCIPLHSLYHGKLHYYFIQDCMTDIGLIVTILARQSRDLLRTLDRFCGFLYPFRLQQFNGDVWTVGNTLTAYFFVGGYLNSFCIAAVCFGSLLYINTKYRIKLSPNLQFSCNIWK